MQKITAYDDDVKKVDFRFIIYVYKYIVYIYSNVQGQFHLWFEFGFSRKPKPMFSKLHFFYKLAPRFLKYEYEL